MQRPHELAPWKLSCHVGFQLGQHWVLGATLIGHEPAVLLTWAGRSTFSWVRGPNSSLDTECFYSGVAFCKEPRAETLHRSTSDAGKLRSQAKLIPRGWCCDSDREKSAVTFRGDAGRVE